ncbi:MAG: DUF4189 domain-containing protein [Hyphomicrobium sp.]
MFRSFLRAVSALLAMPIGVAWGATIDGDLSDYPNSDKEWVIKIDGGIDAGDCEKLAKLVGTNEGQKGIPIYLELNSEGGSFDEAMKIARFMLDRTLSTRLGSGAQCLSACSIIFMAGTRLTTIGPTLERRMHRTAKLGFHAPELSVPAGVGDANEAYDEAIEGIGSKLLALARFRGRQWNAPLMRPDLVNEMMLHHGKNFHYVDTVGNAVENDIEIDDAGGPAYSKRAYVQACMNYLALHASREVVKEVFGGGKDLDNWGVEETRDQYEKKTVVPMSRGQCTVMGGLGEEFGDRFYVSEANGEQGTLYIAEAWAYWPAETKLSTLPSAPSEKEPLKQQFAVVTNTATRPELQPETQPQIVPPFVPGISVSWNYGSREEGERQALSGCSGSCKIALWVVRSCGAIAVGQRGGWGTGWHQSQKQARKLALSNCKQNNQGCEIKKAFCSPGGYGAVAVQNPP